MAAIVLVLPRIALRAFYALLNGLIDINCLMTIASLGACALELTGSDSEGGYLEGAAVLVLFSLSDWLESQASSRARDAISAIVSLSPEVAIDADTGAALKAEGVQVGHELAVRPGTKIAIDGVVVSSSPPTPIINAPM